MGVSERPIYTVIWETEVSLSGSRCCISDISLRDRGRLISIRTARGACNRALVSAATWGSCPWHFWWHPTMGKRLPARSRFSDSYLCAGCVNGVCPLYDCWLGAQSGGRDSTLKAGRGTRPSSQGPSSQTQHPSCIHVSPIANPSYTGSGASFSFGSHPIAMH